MAKKLTTELFIQRAKEIHGNLYDYSQVVYKNMHTKVKIIDPEFGEFLQTPMGHVIGKQGHRLRGFKESANKRRMSLDEFITQANKIHGNLYNYSKVEYIHCDEKICIIDPKYGEFWQTPYNHLRNHGCPERTKNKEWLINVDHIIPMSIICTQNRQWGWVKDRPLYKFLNSEINLQETTAKFNKDKHDKIIINGVEFYAGNVRNNYDVIKYLCKSLLNIDVSNIIDEDRQYINKVLSITDK